MHFYFLRSLNISHCIFYLEQRWYANNAITSFLTSRLGIYVSTKRNGTVSKFVEVTGYAQKTVASFSDTVYVRIQNCCYVVNGYVQKY